MRARLPLIGALVGALALPTAAGAQELVRERFTYVGNDLVIHVDAGAPGELHLTRGGIGHVQVAGRTAGGFAAFALAGRGQDRLSLAAPGAERAQYMVAVPPDTRVRIHLPDRPVAETLGSLQRAAAFAWDAPAVHTVDAPPPEAGEEHGADATLPFRFDADVATHTVTLSSAFPLRALGVRWEGSAFRVLSSHAATILERDGIVEILPGAGTERMVLLVPRDAADFRLESPRGTLLLIEDDQIVELCPPFARQALDADRDWFTFTRPPEPAPCTP